MTETEKVLPSIPSELIRIAVRDFNLALASDEYRIEMGVWHNYDGTYCEVCLAGTVIAGELGASVSELAFPQHYSNEISNKLTALDELRCGNLRGFIYRCRGKGLTKHQDNKLSKIAYDMQDSISSSSCDEDWDAFTVSLEECARELEVIGL